MRTVRVCHKSRFTACKLKFTFYLIESLKFPWLSKMAPNLLKWNSSFVTAWLTDLCTDAAISGPIPSPGMRVTVLVLWFRAATVVTVKDLEADNIRWTWPPSMVVSRFKYVSRLWELLQQNWWKTCQITWRSFKNEEAFSVDGQQTLSKMCKAPWSS